MIYHLWSGAFLVISTWDWYVSGKLLVSECGICVYVLSLIHVGPSVFTKIMKSRLFKEVSAEILDCGFLTCDHETDVTTFFCLQRHEISNWCSKHQTPAAWALTQNHSCWHFPIKMFAKMPRSKQTFNDSWQSMCMTVVNILSSSHQIKWDGRVNKADGLLRRLVRRKGWDFWIYSWRFETRPP